MFGHYRYAITILVPLVVLGLALFMSITCSLASLKILSGAEAPAVVLTSDYHDKAGLQTSHKVSTMYDWAKGVGAKAEVGLKEMDEVKLKQSQEDRLRAKRQRKVVDQVFAVIRENMINLRLNATAIFEEFDEDSSGFLSYWEFTKGLERLGVKLSDARLEMIMKDLDVDGTGQVSLVEFENALALNQ